MGRSRNGALQAGIGTGHGQNSPIIREIGGRPGLDTGAVGGSAGAASGRRFGSGRRFFVRLFSFVKKAVTLMIKKPIYGVFRVPYA